MTRTCCGFDCPKDPGILKSVLVQANWFAAAGGDAPAPDCVQSEATLIAGPDPNRLLIIGWNGGPHLIGKPRLKLPYGVRVFFGLVGRGTFGFAPSL